MPVPEGVQYYRWVYYPEFDEFDIRPVYGGPMNWGHETMVNDIKQKHMTQEELATEYGYPPWWGGEIYKQTYSGPFINEIQYYPLATKDHADNNYDLPEHIQNELDDITDGLNEAPLAKGANIVWYLS